MSQVSSSVGEESSEQEESSTAEPFYTFEDSQGNTVVLEEQPQRVISLMGSYAETWMLAGGELVGVTDDVISERNLEVPETAKIIGTQHSPNLEEILGLSPDFVLLSPDVEEHVQLAQTLEKAGIAHALSLIHIYAEAGS